MLGMTDDSNSKDTHTHTRTHTHARTHAHTHSFNDPFSVTPRVSRYQKGKPIWTLLEQESVSGSGSGISWAVCKSAHSSRQIATPAPHHTDRMPFLPPNQQCQSTEDLILILNS